MHNKYLGISFLSIEFQNSVLCSINLYSYPTLRMIYVFKQFLAIISLCILNNHCNKLTYNRRKLSVMPTFQIFLCIISKFMDVKIHLLCTHVFSNINYAIPSKSYSFIRINRIVFNTYYFTYNAF